VGYRAQKQKSRIQRSDFPNNLESCFVWVSYYEEHVIKTFSTQSAPVNILIEQEQRLK